jgi:hypothetical protein
VHISEATKDLLDESRFEIEARPPLEIKGKGLMETFWVNRCLCASWDSDLEQEWPTLEAE